MSASSKKKLRKEQNAAAAAEKQQREKSEAKKLKTYTIIFVTAMVLVVAIALGIVAVNTVNRTGIIEKSTVALTVNDHELSVADLNYFYFDAINTLYSNWYNQYEDMTSVYMQFSLGLDPTRPLDEQDYNPETGETWADYFLDTAIEDAKYYYAIYDDAVKNGHQITELEREELDAAMSSISMWAQLYGYSTAEDYLHYIYGFGADEESFKGYNEVLTMAQSYLNNHSENLTYTDTDRDTYEKDKEGTFSSYSFASYMVSYGSFLTEGTKGEDGSTTYSDEQIAAALAEAKETADSLATSKTVEELDKAVAELGTTVDGQTASSTKYENTLYANVPEAIREWVADSARKEGDIAVLPYTTTGSDGEEVTTAYYVVLYGSKDDNDVKMGNVRHYLVEFEGGTTDSSGNKTYSADEKAEAKAEAEKVLADWLAGNDTSEDSFAALVSEGSDDTASRETGGLFEDINRDSNYKSNFRAWAIDPERTEGETGIVETDYGYHIMYYVGDSELTYREHLITEEMRTNDHEAWYTAIVEAAASKPGNTDRVAKDVVMAPTY